MNNLKTIHGQLLIGIFIVCTAFLNAQDNPAQETRDYKHSIETSPLSPFLQMIGGGIWGIKYDYAFTNRDELKLGISYMNIHNDAGNTNSPALILGYRRFLWKGFYGEYEFWPSYDEFYEKHEKRYYKGIDLWNEFRIGYQFNFTIKETPLFVNVAWPFGFAWYSSNKPDSFYDAIGDTFIERSFYEFPLVFVGFKF